MKEAGAMMGAAGFLCGEATTLSAGGVSFLMPSMMSVSLGLVFGLAPPWSCSCSSAFLLVPPLAGVAAGVMSAMPEEEEGMTEVPLLDLVSMIMGKL